MTNFDIPSGAAYIIITATSFIVWTSLVFLIRLFLRLKVNGPLAWDDVACAAATVIGITSSSLAIVAVHWGLGYDVDKIPESWLEHFYIFVYIMQILYLVAIGLSMISVALLISRVTRFREQVIMAYCLAVLSALWVTVFSFLIGFQCDLPRPWDAGDTSKCHLRWPTWLGATIVNACIELALAKTAFFLVWRVQISFKNKMKIFMAFALRLLQVHLPFPHKDLEADHVQSPGSKLYSPRLPAERIQRPQSNP